MGNKDVKTEQLPLEVISNINYLKSKKIWFIHSQNPKVISCGDAASKRDRLGNTGIPIFDELKSELGYFINKGKRKQLVLVHCRGNQRVDRLKISKFLNAEYQRENDKSQTKGLINPFGKKFRNLIQIFDTSITMKFHPPHTMMTNAGDFFHAFEFKPIELLEKLKNSVELGIIREDNYNNYKKHKIGILTGNGPDSGILLWKKINAEVKNELKKRLSHAFRGDLSFPEVVVESMPEMGISMDLEERLQDTEDIVLKSIIDLCKYGASLICIACNTTQFFDARIEKICSLYNANFISIPKILEDYLKRNKINEFDFIGISHVVDFKRFSAFKNIYNQFEVKITDDKSLSEINRLAFEAKKDPTNNATAQPLGNLIRNKTKTKNIVIALTEISTILDFHKKLVNDKNIIDTLQLLSQNLAQRYVNGIFNTLYLDEFKDRLNFEKLNKISADNKNQIWKILVEIDYEFIPPLSLRDSTTFSFDSSLKDTKIPKIYFDELIKQEIIICKDIATNDIVGFMSYKVNYKIVNDVGKELTTFYVTTVGVTKGARGNGIANQFYMYIESLLKNDPITKIISTRTWSTNKSHIRILESRGYELFFEKKDDRGAGIHTVYYAKNI